MRKPKDKKKIAKLHMLRERMNTRSAAGGRPEDRGILERDEIKAHAHLDKKGPKIPPYFHHSHPINEE